VRLRAAVIPILLAALLPRAAGSAPPLEHGVKAVFLERFARFVEWPAGTFGEPGAPFRIEVVGEDPFEGLLEKAYAQRQIRDRPVAIRHVRTPAEIGPCHLLFVSGRNPALVAEVVARLRGRPILLVGETPGAAAAGLHLNFYQEGERVRFEVNPDALRASGLSMSYLLLQVARSVTPREGER
jgi:hypothetical protein